ncbi:MAG: hypothetical protein K8R69_03565 [Deltaproteobacteria bacterium]|nr:hypothetical protein [Deltaproteobacteria bacterium]
MSRGLLSVLCLGLLFGGLGLPIHSSSGKSLPVANSSPSTLKISPTEKISPSVNAAKMKAVNPDTVKEAAAAAQCTTIKNFQNLCPDQEPGACINPLDDLSHPGEMQTWWDYVNLCGYPDLDLEGLRRCVNTFDAQLGRNKYYAECLADSRNARDCVATLHLESTCQIPQLEQVHQATTSYAIPYQEPLQKAQVAVSQQRLCTLTRENISLIQQVLRECGNIRDSGTGDHNPLLECWDQGRLTLSSNQLVQYQRFVGRQAPCEIFNSDGCWQNYCESNGIR